MTPHGLDRFRVHFRSHVDAYILIGGTACAVQFEQIGASFRSTRDFDVLVLADGVPTSEAAVAFLRYWPGDTVRLLVATMPLSGR